MKYPWKSEISMYLLMKCIFCKECLNYLMINKEWDHLKKNGSLLLLLLVSLGSAFLAHLALFFTIDVLVK
jgi:hypothetical protein